MSWEVWNDKQLQTHWKVITYILAAYIGSQYLYIETSESITLSVSTEFWVYHYNIENFIYNSSKNSNKSGSFIRVIEKADKILHLLMEVLQ